MHAAIPSIEIIQPLSASWRTDADATKVSLSIQDSMGNVAHIFFPKDPLHKTVTLKVAIFVVVFTIVQLDGIVSLTVLHSDRDDGSNTTLQAHEFESVPLAEFPFVTAHDAAAGYLGNGLIHRWFKTQSTGFYGQLDCGARALDVRPRLKNGRLIMQHGFVDVNVLLVDAVAEVVNWSSENPGELVILILSHCDDKDSVPSQCDTVSHDALQSMDIPVLNGDQVSDMTMGDALQRGLQSSGGSIIGLADGAVQENWDPVVECYGDSLAGENAWRQLCVNATTGDHLAQNLVSSLQGPCSDYGVGDYGHSQSIGAHRDDNWSCHCDLQGVNDTQTMVETNDTQTENVTKFFGKKFCCWGVRQDEPWRVMQDYIHATMSGLPVASNGIGPWMVQTHWQYSAGSIVLGLIHGSSILLDEMKSNLNSVLTPLFAPGGRYSTSIVSMVEIDNVCNGGVKLAQGLRHALRQRLRSDNVSDVKRLKTRP